jgi:hypothetical protein
MHLRVSSSFLLLNYIRLTGLVNDVRGCLSVSKRFCQLLPGSHRGLGSGVRLDDLHTRDGA